MSLVAALPKRAFSETTMRTTIREKLVLWVVGLSLAASVELLLRSQINPASAAGLAVILPTLLAAGLFAAFTLRRK
jgi:hypothetical protein